MSSQKNKANRNNNCKIPSLQIQANQSFSRLPQMTSLTQRDEVNIQIQPHSCRNYGQTHANRFLENHPKYKQGNKDDNSSLKGVPNQNRVVQ